jgi:two-component system NtrC family sensor kinase
LRDVVLARAVTDLLALVRYQISAHIRLEQRIAEDIVCRLPDVLLRQALLNILLNAQQAIGENDGEIVVEAAVEDGRLRLSVSDNGPGFPRDLLGAGIRAFVSHRAEGTGLGLSMVQRFARSHGGIVRLANVEPHGACVTIELPCGRVDA